MFRLDLRQEVPTGGKPHESLLNRDMIWCDSRGDRIVGMGAKHLIRHSFKQRRMKEDEFFEYALNRVFFIYHFLSQLGEGRER